MSETRKPQTTTSATTGIEGWKVFLETTPPNTPLKISGLVTRDPSTHFDSKFLDSPPIQLHCERDDGPRRFEPLNKNVGIPLSSKRGFDFITYQCRDCRSAFRTFEVWYCQVSVRRASRYSGS